VPDGMLDLALRYVLAVFKPFDHLIDFDDLHLPEGFVVAVGLARLARCFLAAFNSAILAWMLGSAGG